VMVVLIVMVDTHILCTFFPCACTLSRMLTVKITVTVMVRGMVTVQHIHIGCNEIPRFWEIPRLVSLSQN
jgi:hypothetical protein